MGKSQKTYMSIRSKLMAAVAMLLVASFMVVSSTYAWFTLSTAPEVTGIKTSIGSNGNLEILLLSTDESGTSWVDPDTITTGVSQTGVNTVWGNIVDLSKGDYGLDSITLMPSQLNLDEAEEGYKLNVIPLLTPLYGPDGRPSELADNTVTGTYKNTVFKSGGYGVRAIGTASSMTPQQLKFVSANSAYNTAKTTARTTAAKTFENYGNQLASIVANHVAAGKTTEGDTLAYDIRFVETMLNELTTANENVAKVLENYLWMYVASYAGALAEGEWNTLTATISDLASLEAAVKTAANNNENILAALPGYTEAKAKYEAIATAIGKAQNSYKNEVSNPITANWEEVNKVLRGSGLVDIDMIMINNKSQADMDFVEVATQDVSVQFPAESGVYADIAEVTSDYSADVSVTISGAVLNKISSMFDAAKDVTKACRIETKVGAAVIAFDLPQAPASNGSSDAEATITDFYGYALDFGFRTNAIGSKLMLQTTAVNRIYSDGGVEDTMGHGSTMTFSTTGQLNAEATEKLMSALRIVFVDSSDNNKVLGVGALPQYKRTATVDETTGEVNGFTISTDELDGQYANDGGIITAPIHLYEFTYTKAGGVELGLKIEANDKGKTELVSLVANDAKEVSVLVYLEGSLVDNSMVASEGLSLDGKLNLQFSSSANLVPMNYTPLKDQTATEEDDTHTHTYNNSVTEYNSDETYHYAKCDTCDEYNTTGEAHVDADSDDVCDVCGYGMTPAVGG